MTYQEAIINFMQGKNKKINEIKRGLREKAPCYFGKKDKEAILKWTDKGSRIVWHSLNRNIENEHMFGLVGPLCPFCLYHKVNCDKCDYGKNHGQCDADGDCDWGVIMDIIADSLLYCGLNENFYRELWNSIESKRIK